MDDYYGQQGYNLFLDEKPKKKHQFAIGLIVGILVTTVIFSLAAGIGVFYLYRNGSGRAESRNKYGAGSQGEDSYGVDGSGLNMDEVEEKLSNLNMYIDQTYLFDYDKDALTEGIYAGYIDALGDPYTEYYTADEYQAMMESASGAYYGIGVMLSQDVNTGVISVVRVFSDSPALEAEVQAGDVLYAVRDWEVTGEDLNSVVAQVKGEEGTAVSLTFYRPSTGEYIKKDVERRQVEMDTVQWEMLDNNIGYLSILEFDEVTEEQFKKGMEELQAQGMESLILDLRDNPGGWVDSVVAIADELVPEGIIVSMESSNGKVEEYRSDDKYTSLPLVVLVNGQSASASEILSGAIRDYKVGTLIGETTYGKGIAQTVYPLGDGTAIKITTAAYYTPSGENIHQIGITPDIEVEQDEETEEDEQLEAAVRYLTEEE